MGGSATPLSETAAEGAIGHDGANACVKPRLGGETAQTTCDGVASSSGGNGGSGANGDPVTVQGQDGVQGTFVYEHGLGGKGKGQSLQDTGWGCALNGNGHDGEDGASGSAGKGGTSIGTIDPNGWLSAPGENGTNGKPGQGGGGGGGAKAPTSCPGATTLTGASGGSGGGGGCGGKGGLGGGGGGASIALLAVDSAVSLPGCKLQAGAGGQGGSGAAANLAGAEPSTVTVAWGSTIRSPRAPAVAEDLAGMGPGGGSGGHSLAILSSMSAPATFKSSEPNYPMRRPAKAGTTGSPKLPAPAQGCRDSPTVSSAFDGSPPRPCCA